MTIRFVPAHTQSALGVIATERERTKAERNAFTRFADRVGDFETTSHNTGRPHEPPATRYVLQSESGSDTTLARSRDAYRETMMSVPHYDEEYDESLREHLATEFGPEVATTLTDGNPAQFTSSLQDCFITGSRTKATSRDVFLAELKTETHALQTADEQLTTLGKNLSCLLDTRSLDSWSQSKLSTGLRKLQITERECEALSTDRQATLQTSRLPSFQRVDLQFEEYLYQSLSVTYPILADISSLLRTLDSLESDVSHALDDDEADSPSLSATTAPDRLGGDLVQMVENAVEAFREGHDSARGLLTGARTALAGGEEGCRELAAHARDGYAHPFAHLLLHGIIADGESATEIQTKSFGFDPDTDDEGTSLKSVECGH